MSLCQHHWHISKSHIFPVALDEVLCNQREHRMWSNADVKGGEACVEAQWTTLSHGLCCTIYGTLVHQFSCNWVFTKSNGKEKKDAKKPAIAEAPKTCGAPVTPASLSLSLAEALKANMPKFSAMARLAVGPAPAMRPPTPSAATILPMVVKTLV